MPEPRQPWLGRRKGRHEQETLEEANTAAWLIRIKLPDQEPVAAHFDERGRTVIVRPSDSAVAIHRAVNGPPWTPAPAPPRVWNEMTGPPGKSFSQAHLTAGQLAEQQVRDSIDRALSPAPDEPTAGEQEAWQQLYESTDSGTEEPDSTIVRGIKAITAEDLGGWVKDLPQYGGKDER